jgi:hypothetical protein
VVIVRASNDYVTTEYRFEDCRIFSYDFVKSGSNLCTLRRNVLLPSLGYNNILNDIISQETVIFKSAPIKNSHVV